MCDKTGLSFLSRWSYRTSRIKSASWMIEPDKGRSARSPVVVTDQGEATIGLTARSLSHVRHIPLYRIACRDAHRVPPHQRRCRTRRARALPMTGWAHDRRVPNARATYSAMNTSLCGNLLKADAGCPKFVARTSGGLLAIHCDRSMASYTPLLNPMRTRHFSSPTFSIECPYPCGT